MNRTFALAAAATILLLSLAGCGQKGPLYLPEPEKAPAGEQAE